MLSNFLMLAAIKCYGDLGCFRLDGPFQSSSSRPLSVAPKPPEVVNTTFLFYSRIQPLQPHVVPWRRKKLALPRDVFSAHRKSKFIVHGFQENGFTKQWIKDLVSELLRNDDFNVVVVDWGHGSSLPYHQAVANARLVGAVIAQLVKNLQKKYKVTAESFHIIGHSLGAHIAGYAGEKLQEQKIGRITGLDPAQPYFQDTDPVVRLDSSDAQFVDVIHTDMRSIYVGGMGTSQESGHIDFFPNGGRKQPGCDNNWLKAVHEQNGDFYQGTRDVLTCRHKRAYILFTESVNSECPFQAVRCRSNIRFRKGECFQCNAKNKSHCMPMGFHTQRPQQDKHSRFYVRTGATGPYCRYHQRVTVHLSKNSDLMADKGRLFARLIHINGTHSRRLHFAPKEVHFFSGNNISSILGTRFKDGVTLVRLQWRSTSNVANPFDYFNGVIRSISVHRITIETLETGSKATYCAVDPKQRELLPHKVYEYIPSDYCLFRNRRRNIVHNNYITM